MKACTLITGASSGIGRELASCAAGDHRSLILVSRDESALKQVAASLNTDCEIIVADLSDPKGMQYVYDECTKQNLVISELINNAGVGDYGVFAESSLEKQQMMIQLNITAVTTLTRLFLPQIIEHKGKIMNVGSVASFLPGPLMSTYFSTKHFVLAFSESIAEELRPQGVSVTCLCPGPTKSNFGTEAHVGPTNSIATTRTTASQVARFGWKAMQQRKTLAIYGFTNKIIIFVTNRFLPRSLVRWLVLRNQG